MHLPELGIRVGGALAAVFGGVGQLEQDKLHNFLNPNNNLRDQAQVVPGNLDHFRQQAGIPDYRLEPFPHQPETASPPETQATENVALVRLDPNADFPAVTYEIRKHGGTVTVEIPGYGLIGNIPPNLQLDEPIIETRRQPFSPEELSQITDPQQKRWAQAWNEFITQPYISTQEIQETSQIVDDALEVPPEEKPSPDIQTQGVISYPSWYDTSEFALGRIVADIVTPESEGDGENWTEEERVQVLAENINAFHWLVTRYSHAGANLTFVIPPQSATPVATSWEPIQTTMAEQYDWVVDVMAAKGFTEGSHFYRVYENNNQLREQYGALWAFTMFVVDSSNDSDNRFADDRFAYAYLGGPFLVMTSGNNGYGLSNMDAVAAHEIGHIFMALDQYYSAYQSCTHKSGYLGVENQNSQYGDCLTDIISIMRGQTYPFRYGYLNPAPAGIDPYGAGQVGWRDGWRYDCTANQWVEEEGGMLDPAGGLCWQIDTSASGVISATVNLHPLSPTIATVNPVIHPNRFQGAWAKSGETVFDPSQTTIAPDGQTLTVTVPVPAETAPLDICVGSRLQNICQNLIPRPTRLIFLPIIRK